MTPRPRGRGLVRETSRSGSLGGIGLVIAMLLAAPPARSETDELEETLDDTLRDACHGWIATEAFDALARGVGLERSPRCDPDAASPSTPAWPARPEARPSGPPRDLGPRHDPNLDIEIECEMEFMCVQSRVGARRAGYPLSQADYERIALHCDQRYGCIEDWLEDWPRPLPAPATASRTAPTERTKPGPAPAEEGMRAPAPAPVPAAHAPTRTASVPSEDADAVDDNPIFAIRYAQSGHSRDTLEARYAYTNRAAVPLRIGPVRVHLRCADGREEVHGLGPSLDVMPGREAAGTWSPSETPARELCAGSAITDHRAEPLPPASQPGIGGPEEQTLVCRDGRRLYPVVQMQEDGRHFRITSSDGGALVVTAASWDARAIAATFCGGTVADYGSRVEWVAEGRAYLSNDFGRYVRQWSQACSEDPDACQRLYRRANGTP